MTTTTRGLSILYVGTLPPHPGGSAISGSVLVTGFASLGHRLRAIAPITAESLQEGETFARQNPDLSITRYVVPYFDVSPNQPTSNEYRDIESVQVRVLVESQIAHERPDILLLGRETFARFVPDIAREHSIPCVLRVAGGTTIGVLLGTIPELLAQQLIAQYRKVELLISPARHMAEQLRSMGLNVKVIPNAIDLATFVPTAKNPELLRELKITDGNVVVAHVSNLKPLKRPLDVVRSAKEAINQDPRLIYLIVGDGQCRQKVENLCRNERIIERFRFTGWIDYERMPDYINLADIVLMPASADTQPRVYLETQACARLLLASDIAAAREVIVDGETGLLFRCGDISDLTERTLQAAADAQLRRDIGRQAREYVMVHSVDLAVNGYLGTFADIIAGRHIAG